MKEDLRFNIDRANEIIRLYEKRRRVFLEMNLILVTVFSVTFGLWLDLEFLKIASNYWLLTCFIIHLLITFSNIIWNLVPNKTREIKDTICKGYSDYQIDQLNGNSFENDYKQQLKNTQRFQDNYSNIASITRWITLFALMSFIVGLGGSIVIRENFNLLGLTIVIVIIIVIIPFIITPIRNCRNKPKSINEKIEEIEKKIKFLEDEKKCLNKKLETQNKSIDSDN